MWCKNLAVFIFHRPLNAWMTRDNTHIHSALFTVLGSIVRFPVPDTTADSQSPTGGAHNRNGIWLECSISFVAWRPVRVHASFFQDTNKSSLSFTRTHTRVHTQTHTLYDNVNTVCKTKAAYSNSISAFCFFAFQLKPCVYNGNQRGLRGFFIKYLQVSRLESIGNLSME